MREAQNEKERDKHVSRGMLGLQMSHSFLFLSLSPSLSLSLSFCFLYSFEDAAGFC
jgi:hypothetical protein